MGHYEDLPSQEYYKNLAKLKKNRTKLDQEISDILESNPIRYKDIHLGSTLQIYRSLLQVPKAEVTQFPYLDYICMKENEILLRVMDSFKVYDIHRKTIDMDIWDINNSKPHYIVRVYNPKMNNPFLQCWFDIRYFELKR
jgi:hypothetical protein